MFCHKLSIRTHTKKKLQAFFSFIYMNCYRALLYMEINIVLKWPRPSRPLNSFTLTTESLEFVT